MGGRLEESKIRLTQPSLAETGAELGNTERFIVGISRVGYQHSMHMVQT